MELAGKMIKPILEKWKSLYITYKVIFIICTLCFISIIASVFDKNLNASNNISIIRITFSSIIGFLLEDSSKNKVVCNDKVMFFRNLMAGLVSISIIIVIIISYIYEVDINNTSLIFLKNVLSSHIGFLISACKDCGE